ncbi:GGDEF domain-containing protein [Silanimonas lenta]|uniref:GGDEF domain-containing protein n=1 Tax=Silanimonas lenta TaxID=265429 RepID=UPI00040CBBD4|nr:GGDEF domain-containing protein [Silanimonas lenta]
MNPARAMARHAGLLGLVLLAGAPQGAAAWPAPAGTASPAPAAKADWATLDEARARMESGDFDEALARLGPLAGAEDPALRRHAGVALVMAQAATRDLVAGHARLHALMAEEGVRDDPALARQLDLAAARLYNASGQFDLALRHAHALLEGRPDAADRCRGGLESLLARLGGGTLPVNAGEFQATGSACDLAGLPREAARTRLARARWERQSGRVAEAEAELRRWLPDMLALNDTGLAAELRAEQAEALLALGRPAEARRSARAALADSASLPSGRALLAARRVLYQAALAEGDARDAARQLQALMAAEHAYAGETHAAQMAYQAGRHEALLRQQAQALLEAETETAALEAAEAGSRALRNRLLLVPAGLVVAGLLLYAAQRRRHRQRYQQLARHDALTGLWTRSHFTETANHALARHQRESRPMALLLFDLDHFSRLNATHGHLSGDRVLAAVGVVLPIFAALLAAVWAFVTLGWQRQEPHAGLDEGLGFAERCREAIAALHVPAYESGEPITVTASFGVASTATVGYRLRDLLSNADAALYRAKSAGRNRVAAAIVAPVQDLGLA